MKLRSLPLLLSALLLGPAVVAQSEKAFIAAGDSLLAIDRPQKAMAQFDKAVEQFPSANSFSARARGWYVMDRLDRFLLDVDHALKLDSLHIEANYQRAVYAFRSEDNYLTEQLSDRALDHGAATPLREKLLILRGEARAAMKKNALAITDLREGLGDRTDDLAALKTLARLYDASGDHAASLGVLEKLCAVEAEEIGNWTNRGYELAELGRYEEALQVYEQALSMDKDEPTALSNRAYALLQLGREAEALTDVERSLKAYPANPYALRTRALLRLRKGERDKACSDLSLAKILGDVPQVDELIKEHCDGGTQR
ncbi:MAG TPA: tetratricopeptide repeat protein [Flavobacteriales bacterium]|jgi:tetratricopeptide (TPR) repeat protein|nr:tetratricopeptide repeat protein [Flavobacteriales bacterium]